MMRLKGEVVQAMKTDRGGGTASRSRLFTAGHTAPHSNHQILGGPRARLVTANEKHICYRRNSNPDTSVTQLAA
jgi:hypothetical protein